MVNQFILKIDVPPLLVAVSSRSCSILQKESHPSCCLQSHEEIEVLVEKWLKQEKLRESSQNCVVPLAFMPISMSLRPQIYLQKKIYLLGEARRI